MSKKVWYHLRVREMIRPGHWVKKSKFYLASRPSEAAEKYTNRTGRNGTDYTIMWCRKDRRHDSERLVDQTERLWRDIQAEQRKERRGRLGDVGEFLRLGGELFQELRQSEKEKVIKRRYNGRQEKEATY